MKLKVLVLSLVTTCSMISPVLAQNSLLDSEYNRRMRDQQSLDAQAQYNTYYAANVDNGASQIIPTSTYNSIGRGILTMGIICGVQALRRK